jgi:UrcA family protein
MSITSKLLQGVSLSILSLACAAAYADTQLQPASLVRYSDLNLQRPSDVAKLYERIAAAADRVCGPRSLTGSYSKSAIYASCYDDAVAQAVARINQTPLTLYYEQRVQHAAPALAVASK